MISATNTHLRPQYQVSSNSPSKNDTSIPQLCNKLLMDFTTKAKSYNKIIDSDDRINNSSLIHDINKQAYPSGIKRLYDLEDNWDGYGSPKPSVFSIEIATDIITSMIISSNYDLHIAPSPDGGVVIEYRTDDQHIGVEICNDEVLFGFKDHGHGLPQVIEYEPNEISEVISFITQTENSNFPELLSNHE